MRDHVDAVKALLEAHEIDSYWVDVPGSPKYPYVLLWGPAWGNSVEGAASGDKPMDRPLMATCVAENADVLLTFVELVKTILDRAQPAVPGRHAALYYRRSEVVDVDRKITIPITNRHPAFAVENYRYRSQQL